MATTRSDNELPADKCEYKDYDDDSFNDGSKKSFDSFDEDNERDNTIKHLFVVTSVSRFGEISPIWQTFKSLRANLWMV